MALSNTYKESSRLCVSLFFPVPICAERDFLWLGDTMQTRQQMPTCANLRTMDDCHRLVVPVEFNALVQLA